MKKVIVVLSMLFFAGCDEGVVKTKVLPPDIRPLSQQMTPASQEWKDAYGDTLENQIIFNLAVLRNNDMVIAKTINNLHPPIDANLPTLESRVKNLEDNKIIPDKSVEESK